MQAKIVNDKLRQIGPTGALNNLPLGRSTSTLLFRIVLILSALLILAHGGSVYLPKFTTNSWWLALAESGLLRLDTLNGLAIYLFAAELSGICGGGIYLLFRLLRSKPMSEMTSSQELTFRMRLLLTIAIGFLLYSQISSFGRPILSTGILMPGSFATRLLVVDCATWLRRFIEPMYWGLLIVIILCATFSVNRDSSKHYLRAVVLGVALLLLEISALMPFISTNITSGSTIALFVTSLHFLLVQGFLLGIGFALAGELLLVRSGLVSFGLFNRDLSYQAMIGLLAIFTLAFGLAAYTSIDSVGTKPLIGAHYYSWFPENWKAGYLGENLDPPIEPVLGKYDSGNSWVMLQHVNWAKEAGIDYFIFDWWAERPNIGKRIKKHVLRTSIFDDFKFALQFETLDLKSKAESPVPGEDPNAIYLTPQRLWWMERQWEHLAKTYMTHPSYLRINGRPVLYLYATRHLLGPVAQAIEHARLYVKVHTGEDLFLVADEAFFNVLSTKHSGRTIMLASLKPEWNRLIAFDALTSYNPYDSTRLDHAGEKGVQRFVDDVATMFHYYSSVSKVTHQVFVPTIIPGYNDRGVRLNVNHYVIPRTLEGPPQSSLFSTAIERWVKPTLDPATPMMAITSWNEWNEGTQIEPTKLSAPTTADITGEEELYTQHQIHQGYGCQYLEELNSAWSSSEAGNP